MGNFKLVNPILAGNIKTEFDENDSAAAAETFWKTLTSDNKLIANEIFKFIFTLEDTDNNLHHFSVIEKEKSKGNVEYKIENITKEIEKRADPQEMKQFKKEVSRVQSQINDGNVPALKGGKKVLSRTLKAKGGKHKKDDSSSSSSSSSSSDDEFDFSAIRKQMYKTPISYWWYSPMIYKVRRLYTPAFVHPIAPYVQLWMPMR
jgi:hypothetical protein